MMTAPRSLFVEETEHGRNRMDLSVHPELSVRLKMEQEDVTVRMDLEGMELTPVTVSSATISCTHFIRGK